MNNKKIISVLAIFSVMFLSLVFYLTYTGIKYHDAYTQSNYNKRNGNIESKVLRGQIFDRNGKLLAYSEMNKSTQKRIYPYNNLYSHVIGYASSQFGRSLIEKEFNKELLNQSSLKEMISLENIINNTQNSGNDLVLTIDHNLQTKAHAMMQNYKGALVAMNPKTGEILAMVSMPDFDPNHKQLINNWSQLNSSNSAPFLTRAISGLYAPGSTYKVITTANIIESGLEKTVIDDKEGKIEIVNKEISNSHNTVYGETDLTKAFTKSSNVYYAKLGSQIKQKSHVNMAERFLLNKEIPFDLPVTKSNFETKKLNELGYAITSIGQGATLMTPLHLTLVTSAIANNGVMQQPYIVSEITKNGKTISKTSPKTITSPISPDVAIKIKRLMRETVKSGTGTKAAVQGIEISGKTGTSENEMTQTDESKTHALFIGFAPYDNPEIAICVILENAGYGGSVAAPVAREVFRTYFSNKQ